MTDGTPVNNNLPPADPNAANATDERSRAQPASRKYKTIIKSLKRYCDFISSPELDNLDFIRSDVRYEQLTEKWKELNELHLEIIDNADDAAADTYEQMLAETEDRFIEALSLLRIHIDNVRPLPVPSNAGDDNGKQSSQDSGKQQINVQVKYPEPPIKNVWGKFDGDLTTWKGFHDRYVAKLHSKDEHDAATKYMHLKKSLFGEAAQVFGDGEPNAATYMEAWERLCKVYNRPYQICRAHVQQLQNLPVLTEPSTAAQLRNMTSNTLEQLRQLKAHGINVEAWDIFICTVLHDRLKNETGRQWELNRKSETPTAVEMIEFLDKQADALAGMNENVTPSNFTVSIKNDRMHRSQSKESGKSSRSSSVGKPFVKPTKKHFPCEACNGDHMLYDCPQFDALNLNGRKDFVDRRNLCPNCFKRGHGKENCYSVKCGDTRCKKDPAHNSTLCPFKQTPKQTPLMVSVRHDTDDWARSEGAWALPAAQTNKQKKKGAKRGA